MVILYICKAVYSVAVFLCPLGWLVKVESQVTTLGYNCWSLLLYDYRVVKGYYFLFLFSPVVAVKNSTNGRCCLHWVMLRQ